MPSEDAQEVADILDAVTGRVPTLLRSVIDQLYSAEAGRQMGKAIGAFYKELTEAGLPPERALQLAEDYASPFSIVRSMLGESGQGISWSMGGHRTHGTRESARKPAGPMGPGPLESLFNSAGTSDDGSPDAADLDGVGWSLSAQALAEAGVRPGQELSAEGLTYRWPDAAPGQQNNVEASGQTVRLPARPDARRLGFLGLATHGPSAGVATLRYADGRTQPIALCFPDWTLGGGDGELPAGTHIAARMPRRNGRDGEDTGQQTMVFATSVGLAAGAPVETVTLPTHVDQGALHIFAVALGE